MRGMCTQSALFKSLMFSSICPDVLLITESVVLRSPTVMIELPISPFSSASFCFVYFGALDMTLKFLTSANLRHMGLLKNLNGAKASPQTRLQPHLSGSRTADQDPWSVLYHPTLPSYSSFSVSFLFSEHVSTVPTSMFLRCVLLPRPGMLSPQVH